MNFPCWHKWGKYSDPVNGIACTPLSDTGYFKVIQMRICEKCGLADIRSVPKMRHIDSIRNEGKR
jgi:hypothetical protein